MFLCRFLYNVGIFFVCLKKNMFVSDIIVIVESEEY